MLKNTLLVFFLLTLIYLLRNKAGFFSVDITHMVAVSSNQVCRKAALPSFCWVYIPFLYLFICFSKNKSANYDRTCLLYGWSNTSITRISMYTKNVSLFLFMSQDYCSYIVNRNISEYGDYIDFYMYGANR